MSDLAVIPYQDLEIIFDDYAEPWLTQKQIAKLLGIGISNVNKILKNAMKAGDLADDSVIELSAIAEDGKSYNVKHYSLDSLLIVAFRSRATKQAIVFRKWIAWLLREQLTESEQELNDTLYTLDETREQLTEAERDAAYALADLNDRIYSDVESYYSDDLEGGRS